MWTINGDEFNYEETVAIEVPVSLVYEAIADVDKYDEFITDVVLSEMESETICRMIVRAGPLRVNVRSRVSLTINKEIEFEMIDGPPLELLRGKWTIVKAGEGSEVTFSATIKAGRAGKWLLKAASRYVERKGAVLINTFHKQILKAWHSQESGHPVPSRDMFA